MDRTPPLTLREQAGVSRLSRRRGADLRATQAGREKDGRKQAEIYQVRSLGIRFCESCQQTSALRANFAYSVADLPFKLNKLKGSKHLQVSFLQASSFGLKSQEYQALVQAPLFQVRPPQNLHNFTDFVEARLQRSLHSQNLLLLFVVGCGYGEGSVEAQIHVWILSLWTRYDLPSVSASMPLVSPPILFRSPSMSGGHCDRGFKGARLTLTHRSRVTFVLSTSFGILFSSYIIGGKRQDYAGYIGYVGLCMRNGTQGASGEKRGESLEN
ncbi:hypothetical protein R3P38DRAFT_2810748 [Favolaschia claudopus]|uniref:Uncharacterized protein n=1 Tax=Favolaschia claudopus TaxID=2862362 RepID=A0AAV9ZA72_9AGAR